MNFAERTRHVVTALIAIAITYVIAAMILPSVLTPLDAHDEAHDFQPWNDPVLVEGMPGMDKGPAFTMEPAGDGQYSARWRNEDDDAWEMIATADAIREALEAQGFQALSPEAGSDGETPCTSLTVVHNEDDGQYLVHGETTEGLQFSLKGTFGEVKVALQTINIHIKEFEALEPPPVQPSTSATVDGTAALPPSAPAELVPATPVPPVEAGPETPATPPETVPPTP